MTKGSFIAHCRALRVEDRAHRTDGAVVQAKQVPRSRQGTPVIAGIHYRALHFDHNQTYLIFRRQRRFVQKAGSGRDQAVFSVWGGPPAAFARLSGPCDAP